MNSVLSTFNIVQQLDEALNTWMLFIKLHYNLVSYLHIWKPVWMVLEHMILRKTVVPACDIIHHCVWFVAFSGLMN